MPHAPDLPPAIFLMGPTASGKTAVAVELVQRLPCEIVSVDSALVYRGMDIGTAKPDAAILAVAPHALIDILDPTQAYSAAQFRHDALLEMARITAAGRIPLLAGGTMLYFKALREGLSELPSADAAVRAELEERARRLGWPALHEELAQVDPRTAQRLQPTDAQRIQRALEVHALTGRPLSDFFDDTAAAPFPYRPILVGLLPGDRAVLHARIAERFDVMLRQGLLEEVEALRARHRLDLSMPSMRCVGYRQAWQHLAGEYDRATLREKGIVATRQLAKRQMTWLRAMQGVEFLDCLATDLRQQVEGRVRGQL